MLAALAAGAPAVVPVLPVVDTTVVVDDDGLVTGALPTASRCAACRRRRASTAPSSSAPTPRSRPVPSSPTTPRWSHASASACSTVAGDERAAKVTVAHDLELAAGCR